MEGDQIYVKVIGIRFELNDSNIYIIAELLRIKKKTIDDVLLEHVGVPHVLPLAVHLEFFMLVG